MIEDSGGMYSGIENIKTEEILEGYLGVPIESDKFNKWKDKSPELSDREILISCLYNKVTREQSLWVKRSDLPDPILDELDDYLHETSKITAEIVISKEVSEEELNGLGGLRRSLEDTAIKEGVLPKEVKIEAKPEPEILTFIELIRQEKERDFLEGPVLVVGLTTHGDVPAYVVSKLLDEKGVENQVVFIRPTSRGKQKVVEVLPKDKIVLERATSKNIFIVDDSIETGESMKQSLAYLNDKFDQPKTACVGAILEQEFLTEIEGEAYTTVTYEGKKVYSKASFQKPITK